MYIIIYSIRLTHKLVLICNENYNFIFNEKI